MSFAVGAFGLAIAYYFRNDDLVWLPLFYVAFGVSGFLAFLESLTSYLNLNADQLELRKNFRDNIVKRPR